MVSGLKDNYMNKNNTLNKGGVLKVRGKLSDYKAVILAGGKGTRLYPVTLETPKHLLYLNRKPIINHLVDLFLSQGIKEIALLINKEFEDDFIWWKKRYFPQKNIRFFLEKKPLGTFGGLFLLKRWIKKGPFFLVNGDDLGKINLAKMAGFHEKQKSIGTVALAKVLNNKDYGAVIYNSNRITKFVEKPSSPISNYVNSGFYVLSYEIFNYHPGPEFLMIEKDIFPKLAKEGKLTGFKFQGKWVDIGTWDRYEWAVRHWKN